MLLAAAAPFAPDRYITRVVKKDGKPTHELVDTLKGVRPE
jgi:hypothetical protein